jgi:hypothetical protein
MATISPTLEYAKMLNMLTLPGNAIDCTAAIDVLSNVELEGSIAMWGKAYGTKEIREYIENHWANYCIPPRSNTVEPWECDFYQYKERHVVECSSTS